MVLRMQLITSGYERKAMATTTTTTTTTAKAASSRTDNGTDRPVLN
jgi:hypothetical protein